MKASHLAQIAFILAASFGVFSFVRAAQTDQRLTSCQAICQLRPAYAAHNRTVPDFELPDGEGKMVRFSSFLGDKPVVLNFWTKTCKPCLEEMPAIAELAGILKSRGVEVVTINTDEGPEAVADTLQVVLQGQEPPFHILYDPEMEVVQDMFGTELYPETWLIDGDGVIRARVDGPRNWSSAVPLEVIEMIGRPGGCPVQFLGGKPVGPYAGLCGEDL